MTVVKCLMQDTLYSLVKKSMSEYVDFFEKFIPEKVNVEDVGVVNNIFAEEIEEEKLNTTNDLIEMGENNGSTINIKTMERSDLEDDFLIDPCAKWPLFQINLTKREDKRIEYTTKSEDLLRELLNIFDEGLEKMQKIRQVEPLLLSNLIKAGKAVIPLKSITRPRVKPSPRTRDDIKDGFELNEDSIWICELYEKLESSIQKACEPLQPYLDTFQKYKDAIKLDPTQYLRRIQDDQVKGEDKYWTNQKIHQDVIANKEKEKSILADIPQIIHVSFFQINCKEYRNELANKFSKIADLQIEFLKEKAKDLNGSILNGYSRMKHEISREVVTINDLKAVQAFMETVPIEIQKLKEQSAEVEEIYRILDSFNVHLDLIQSEFRINLIGGPTDIENTIRATNIVLEKKKDILYQEQLQNIEDLKQEIDQLSSNIVAFDLYKTEEGADRAIELAHYVKTKLEDFHKKGQMYNEREMLFGKPRTDWSRIMELDYQFVPYYYLWTGIEKWKVSSKSWLHDNFSKLNGEEVESIVSELSKNFNTALSKFKEKHVNEMIFNLCLKYKTDVDTFKPKADLAVAITKGLKDRHWKELYDRTKIDCTPRDGFTFNMILEAGMLKHIETCMDVGEKAYREQKIEEQIQTIDRRWREILFALTEHKATKLPTISNWNDINKDLDNDIMEVQQLELSSFKGPFTELIASWNRDLLMISSVLEEWNKCQKSWIYLQPVFDSADIAKDIPYEHKKFKMTDRMWQDLMNGLNVNRNVKQCCSMDGLLEKLKEANMNLENVEKGLNDYMENKRTKFPRFYFISNSQFLEILSQTKDIKKVKDNVNKIFEPIDNIDLKEDKYITSIMSRLGEKLEFDDQLLIFGKNVEIWMSQLESTIFRTVRAHLERALEDYSVRPRHEWVSRHPGQIIMCGNQIGWTSEVEQAILTGTLQNYIKTYENRILDLVSLVREKQTRLMSINLANLITIDVHNINVMKDLLKHDVHTIHAFEWIMQLRYYWENSFDVVTKKTMPNCMVKSVQTDFPYGYEYIGNAEILVITPLTDKCYLTLMGALRLNLGGAPAGPAGTGKTESTKDLSRSLGKLCIVYNCSDDTDYVMIGKFFKGLACCGAWICFDEFNRINIEVLSVIAQQLLQLFGAKDKGETEIIFESSQIKILPTFCVFITMNPGYAGRTELPDNLKALFRPIAMMVPDYKLIAQINLYSSGYVQAEDLATKVVSTMKLSSEQLSTQGHYDFGMRAVKSVLNAARRLKRTEIDKEEDQLLLRALEDVNVPKFVKEDIQLFRNIISDLFPRTDRPKIDYKNILDKVDTICASSHYNLVPSESFKQKIIQLYDTLQVRHGLMLVGPAGGGKTSNYSVLKEALSQLADGKNYYKTVASVINPKSIKHSEIYSEQNVDTGEWSFGVLPIIINECKRDTEMQTKYWVIFDGPVDAMWIEDMNSVLDDSKKLCLASSDIILLNEMITIMFETEDLSVASPATVSRCGMVYMEPSALGLEPLYTTWIKKLPEVFLNEKYQMAKLLTKLFSLYLADTVYWVRKNLKEPCPTVDNNLAKSLMRIIDTFFDKFKTPEAKFKKMDDEIKQIESVIEGIFIYACIWSMGVTTNEDGRVQFNKYFREIIAKNIINQKFLLPDEGTVYDYMFDNEKGEWVSWISTLTSLDIPDKAGYTEIIVPTPDSVRNTFLMQKLIKSNKHLITTGPTGTGKTVNIMQLLGKGLGDKYMSIIINFSAQTTARQTQDTIQGKVSRRGRGRYAPEKLGAIFIDDLNMPVKQDSGAQPPIELLRQWLDHGGWYHLGTKSFIYIENIILLGAMGLPGGGRSFLSQRFQRHFNMITYNELDNTSIRMIFGTVVKNFIHKFPEAITGLIDTVIDSTMKVYKEIKLEMLPTPKKMHYIFNLRDMSKVLQGVCSLSNKHATESIDLLRLWVHEMTRVFGDRLVNNEDYSWLKKRLDLDLEQTYKLNLGQVYKYGQKIIYCDFMSTDAYSRTYVQVTNVDSFISKIKQHLETYNQDLKKKKLNLVMFFDACDHVSRICRILRQPQGNALLLGVGGSGRQSLAKLATFINNYDCYQIDVVKGYEMKDFTKNVKECLKLAGIKQYPQTFLIADTQIVYPMMLEYINNILNTGDVPNIYSQQQDKDEIVSAVRQEVLSKYGNLLESNVMKVYLSRVLRNIHVVLAMSPIGESFVQRLRMFPSLVNCCTIDWFSEWPEDALESVAYDNFSRDPMGLGDNIPKIVKAFIHIHKRVEHESKEFSERLRRHVYLTPTSYLELLSMYSKILKKKTNEFNDNIQRFENGLQVLKSAEIEVANMRSEIEIQKPQLQENQRLTQALVVDLEKESKKAMVEEAEATTKEEQANIFDEECSKILAHAEIELAKVLPLIEKAVNSIKKVTKDHLMEQYSYRTLNVGCEKLLEGLLIFKMGNNWKTKDVMSKSGDLSQTKNPYNIKLALIQKINFSNYQGVLADLESYCRPENLDNLKVSPQKDYIDLTRQHFKEKELTYEVCKKSAESLIGLYEYLEALMQFVDDSINKIDPIKKELAKAQEQKEIANKEKEEAIERKTTAQRKVKELNDRYSEALRTEKELIEKLRKNEEKLRRAEELIHLLSGEQSRWTKEVFNLRKRVENLAGDCLIAAGSISYCGPFTYSYRVNLENDWRDKIVQLDLVHTPEITMKDLLEDPIEVNKWKVNGLPNDNLSIENGIIIKNTRRWPLMVDPQNQGSNFIKKFGKREECLNVVKASDPNFINAIKSAIRLERWVLLENVSINLDPTLEPILNQQTIQRGSIVEIKIGDDLLPWSDKFRLHLSTTIPNPHYSPETFVKVTIVNFGITSQGLQEQMMTLLINNEMPELEQRKNAILMENFASQAELHVTEDKILNDLSKSKGGNISEFLESDELIDSLKEAKTKSEEIQQKIEESKETTFKIDKEREKYRPAAERSSLLFFTTIDLSSIDPMYQFSLQWFSKLYENSIKITPNSNNKDVRIANLNKIFTKNLYDNVCRSLFERDKLLFSFMICQKILTGEYGDTKIKPDQWRYFLAGPTGDITIPNNPTKWIGKNEWATFYRQIKYMNDNFPETRGLEEFFMKRYDEFIPIYDSSTPHLDPLPDEWDKVSEFLKLCFLKMIRPDKLISGIQLWIERNIGKEFIEPPPFELAKSYKQSSNIVPLVFILSPGSDPINDIKKFAEDMNYDNHKFDHVSLGRGQDTIALKKLEDMRTRGGWVLLQNCHLAKSFMGKLEEIVENFDTNWPDKDFRLWLTSMPTSFFPVGILQNSVKITYEPPKGLKNNLLMTYKKLDPRELEEGCLKRDEYKTLIFGLSFFHAIVQDRRKFGPVGWNVKYDFTNEDWMVCKKQIKIFLEQYDYIPYQVLDYLIGDINYGGRVTDDKDQRLIKTILKTYLNKDIFDYSTYKFSKSGSYYCPEPGDYDNYLTYIENLPVNSEPEVFGMHNNADIVTAQNEAYSLLETVLGIQPRVASGEGKSPEFMILEIVTDIEKKTPPPFDKEEIMRKFPTDYNESMNTVLLQEIIRYNVLLNIMKKSIKTLKKALTGKIVMSEEFENMSKSLYINQVPKMWSGVFLSLKPLSSWTVDLIERISFFKRWMDSGKTPNVFWFSGFSFPQAFLTAALQNYARSQKIAIDLLSFEFEILDNKKPSDIDKGPESGVYVYGMFLEGARWNYNTHLLDESLPKELYTDVPMIHFKPAVNRQAPTKGVYMCPLYKVLSRAGVLSTTGHSTNYILYVELPTDQDDAVWIKAGVAMFLSLKQ